MQIELLRIVAEGLRDSNYGVNSQIASMSTVGGDDSPPDVSSVKEYTKDEEVADGKLGPEWPVLVVSPDGPMRLEGEVGQTYRDGTTPIAIRYGTAQGNLAAASREALYTLEAVLKFWKDFLDNNNISDRTLDNVVLRSLGTGEEGIEYGQIVEEAQDGMITGAMRVFCHVRDKNP